MGDEKKTTYTLATESFNGMSNLKPENIQKSTNGMSNIKPKPTPKEPTLEAPQNNDSSNKK